MHHDHQNQTTHFGQAELSSRIHGLRRQQKLSQLELAERSGFARSTLSKIENGQLSPTFEILVKLAHGFGMAVSELLRPDSLPPLSGRLYLDDGTSEKSVDYANHRLFPLASPLKGRPFQSFIVEFTCQSLEDFGPWNQHDTDDMLYVLSGQMEFHSDGYEPMHLTEGQSLHFDGQMPHACLSVGKTPCRCLYTFAERSGQ